MITLLTLLVVAVVLIAPHITATPAPQHLGWAD